MILRKKKGIVFSEMSEKDIYCRISLIFGNIKIKTTQ